MQYRLPDMPLVNVSLLESYGILQHLGIAKIPESL